MLMPGRHYNADKYRFGFNGKEHDTEWKGTAGAIYDYGFRIYDPRVAKFLSVDPLTKDYPRYTPYQFAWNMPIWAIDLDGLEPVVIHGRLVGYNVMEGQGPTQIADHINNPATQKEFGYNLMKPVRWQDIVTNPHNDAYFPLRTNTNNGEGFLNDRSDKNDPEYRRLNMNVGDYLEINTDNFRDNVKFVKNSNDDLPSQFPDICDDCTWGPQPDYLRFSINSVTGSLEHLSGGRHKAAFWIEFEENPHWAWGGKKL